MSEQDRNYIVEAPFREIVRAPGSMLGADKVEIRVTLTPLKWYEEAGQRELRQFGECLYTSYDVDRRVIIDSKDTRAMFHIIREMLIMLARAYLGVDL